MPLASEESRGQKTSRQNLLFAIKLCISVTLIYWLLNRTDLSETIMAIYSADVLLVLSAFSLSFIGYFIVASRWRLLLEAQGVSANLIFLIKSCMVAMFFNNFLPSTIGGDLVRAYDSWRIGNSKIGAVTVIMVDRFFGLFALISYALIALLFSNDLMATLPSLHIWLLLGTSAMFLLMWIIFLPSDKIRSFISTRVKLAFPSIINNMLVKIINAFAVFRGQYNILVNALILSLLLQINVIAQYYLIAMSLGLSVPLSVFFFFVPLSIVIMMLPVSINGIGLREAVFIFFFSLFGVANPQALAFAWILFGLLILQGILGGVVYAVRRYS